jgi:hypothetical protein
MGDLDGDGRAALLDTVGDNTIRQRLRARRSCAEYALTTNQPHTTLRELLDQLGLKPQKGEPR